MPGSPGTPSYVANPFAAAPGAQSAAYANALRAYAPNQFAGTTRTQGAMAPHLSQPIPLGPDIAEAYRALRADPSTSQYAVPDIDKLWRQSPTSAIFKPGYAHSPYVTTRAQHIGGERDLKQKMAGMTPEEYYAQQQMEQLNNMTYRGE